MHLIDDSTPIPLYKGRGLDLSTRPEGFAHSAAEPFPQELIVPRSDWEERIKERKANQWGLRYLHNVPCKDQKQTNYCWINSTVYAIELIRARQNDPYVSLSPASVGTILTNGQNIGGWGHNALQFISENGVVPSDLWPDNAIDLNLSSNDSWQIAKKYACDQWWELEPNNLDQLVSALLLNYPVIIGLSWWEHEVCAEDLDWLDDLTIIARNSWGMEWGENGYFHLQGQRILPADAVCPRVMKAA